MRSQKRASKTPSLSINPFTKMEQLHQDKVQYVRAMFPISLNVFTDYLESHGFKNVFEGDLDKILRSHCNYVCVNLTKRCYVLSSSTYKHTTMNSDEFKEAYSGLIFGEQYGI